MANEFSRNIKDLDLLDAAIALPNGAAATVSDDFDLGLSVFKNEAMELEIKIPAITVAKLADGETLTVAILGDSTATPTTVIADKIEIVLGATGTDPSVARIVRYRIPSDMPRFMAVRFTKTGAGEDASSIDASVTLNF